MKRFVLVLVALGAVALFAACKKDAQEGEPATDEAAKATEGEQPAGEQPAAAAGEPESTGIPECDAYIKRLSSCENYPQQAKDALKQSTDAWKQAASAGGESAKAAADACKQAEESAAETLKGLGC